MKVLITGATGLVGTALVAALRSRGHEVSYLTTSKSGKPLPGAQRFFWNVATEELDPEAFEGVDAIVHLAGASIAKRWTSAYKQEIRDSRIASAELLYKVLRTLPHHSVRHFVSASAIGLYADHPDHLYHESDLAFDKGFLGDVVLQWEQAADRFRTLSIKVAKLRTGLVFSKKGGVLEQLVAPVRYGFGAAFGSGKQWQSWIHLDDMVGLYLAALENGWEGTFNAVAPHPVTQTELIRQIGKTLHRPVWLPNIPEFLMVPILGEMRQLVFSSQKVSAKKAIEHGYRFQFPLLPAALTALLTDTKS
ncbi:MAG TPA: TIGR01777 family oxidoreductase [Flavobacterium sp.]|nr:TIGR01777 family oxidoreductase [Flavobacterium sp.]